MLETELRSQRAALAAEIKRLQSQIGDIDDDLIDASVLARAQAALTTVDDALAASKAGVARAQAARDYKALIELQHRDARRQRELSAEIVKLHTVVKKTLREVRPLIQEHQVLVAQLRPQTERLYRLASAADAGLDPMRDCDMDTGAPIDAGLVRLLGLG